MNEPVTTDLILNTMKSWVETKQPIPPTKWLESSLKLTVLSGDETDKLILLETEQAHKYQELVELYDTAAKAKIYLDALPITRDVKRQRAKVKQIDEFIRLSKKWATLSADEMRGY